MALRRSWTGEVANALDRDLGVYEQVVEADAEPGPPAPDALIVQVSPAAPTGSGAEPEHATEPLDGVVPEHV